MNKIAVTFGKEVDNAYLDAVKAAGSEPVALQSTTDPTEWRRVFSECDALLLTGGGDVQPERYELKLSPADRAKFIRGEDAARDDLEIELTNKAVSLDMPVLAICRGIQVLNVALGGTLIHDLPKCLAGIEPKIEHKPADKFALSHEVAWNKKSRLVRDLGRDYPRVNSSHHQAVGRIAKQLTTTAHAPDGVIEAVENPDARFLVGVQFHPERSVEDHSEFLDLFRLFLRHTR
jgi:putative glutamine amidotransferase